MSLRYFVFLFAALLPPLFPPIVSAQVPQEQSELILRSTTRLVQVEVIVRGKDGKPIQGLRQEDFEIYENGKPQKIQFFSDYTLDAQQLERLPDGMVSNRPHIAGPRRGVTVILIDSLNTNWHHREFARNGLLRFLRTAKPDDRIAVYTLGRDLKVVHDFTTDASSLIERVRTNKNGLPVDDPILETFGENLIPEVDLLYAKTEAVHREYVEANRIRQTFDSLEAIAQHMGSTPGWKSLIWISEGIPLKYGFNPTVASTVSTGRRIPVGDQQLFGVEFDRLRKTLSNANVAVFPINPAGLMVWQDANAMYRQPQGVNSWEESNYMMEQLASFTGGRAFTNSNDILGALRETVDDARLSYTLGYYPSDAKFDGKYRTIRVRLRQPDHRANHRKGYFALDEAELKRLNPKDEMSAAARDPLDSSLIGIDGQVLPSKGKLKAVLRIQGGELLWPVGDKHSVDAEVGLFQYDAEGRSLNGFVDSIHFKLDPARAAILARDGMMYSREFVLQPGAVRLRAVVRSVRTGSIGSLTLPFPAPGRSWRSQGRVESGDAPRKIVPFSIDS